jgi:hypothetical protein
MSSRALTDHAAGVGEIETLGRDARKIQDLGDDHPVAPFWKPVCNVKAQHATQQRTQWRRRARISVKPAHGKQQGWVVVRRSFYVNRRNGSLSRVTGVPPREG